MTRVHPVAALTGNAARRTESREQLGLGKSADAVVELRLAHPAIDFWVEVRLREFEGSWLAVADLASTPELAVASRPDLALLLALGRSTGGPEPTRDARADLPG